ncbi:MAG: S41 family peptidase [Bacteroidales bacterium]|nr:S41 family peptidase [Bacteroidales bacterium]
MKIRNHIIIISLLSIGLGVAGTLLVQQIEERNHGKNWKYGEWRKLSLILDEVENNYVDTINVKEMTDAAVSAALEKLDPHSVYLPPVELQSSNEDLAANFEGIGIQFNVPNDTAVVLQVIAGGPSEKAGLLTGDRILKVDEKVIAGTKTPQDSMVRRMRGTAGTKVKLLVERNGEQIAFDITRGKIPLHSIDAAFMLNDTTAYLKLSKFSMSTYKEFVKEAAALREQGMKKLIFDVRGNTGGYLDQAYRLCNEFLEKGDMVVYMEGLHRDRQDLVADGRGKYKDVKLIILQDAQSASSSEIFAGAMQDNDRATILGVRSFGKGLVQEPIDFTDGSGIRLTVARFHTPSGRCIQKPYGERYAYDVYDRYTTGEMTSADSIKVNEDQVYYTKSGRVVYGGGGIIPDIFIPVDTTRATKFYLDCNKKATQVRFASDWFDKHKADINNIKTYAQLESYIRSANLERAFLSFAESRDKLKCTESQWDKTKLYLMPQINALVGRYSPLGENAFYRLYLPIDDTVQKALTL